MNGSANITNNHVVTDAISGIVYGGGVCNFGGQFIMTAGGFITSNTVSSGGASRLGAGIYVDGGGSASEYPGTAFKIPAGVTVSLNSFPAGPPSTDIGAQIYMTAKAVSVKRDSSLPSSGHTIDYTSATGFNDTTSPEFGSTAGFWEP
jgi:hypothetical protein